MFTFLRLQAGYLTLKFQEASPIRSQLNIVSCPCPLPHHCTKFSPQHIPVLASAAHILKLERYREDSHGPCARMTRKFVKRSIKKKKNTHTHTFHRNTTRSKKVIRWATHPLLLQWRPCWLSQHHPELFPRILERHFTVHSRWPSSMLCAVRDLQQDTDLSWKPKDRDGERANSNLSLLQAH